MCLMTISFLMRSSVNIFNKDVLNLAIHPECMNAVNIMATVENKGHRAHSLDM